MIPSINECGRATIARLQAATFVEGYAGYRPNVAEIPDGRGAADYAKQYSHITLDYIESAAEDDREFLLRIFDQCWDRAMSEPIPFGLPPADRNACCLRLLRYPAGAGSAPHTDMSMYTLNIWRSHEPYVWPTIGDVHYGELAEFFSDSAVATRHRVQPACHEQMSLVFFVLPDRNTRLPDGNLVGDWLDARLQVSREAA